MSVTYHIACIPCKKYLWIGQRNYIYTKEPECLESFGEFLYDHQDHELKFVDEHWEDQYKKGWTWIKWKGEKDEDE